MMRIRVPLPLHLLHLSNLVPLHFWHFALIWLEAFCHFVHMHDWYPVPEHEGQSSSPSLLVLESNPLVSFGMNLSMSCQVTSAAVPTIHTGGITYAGVDVCVKVEPCVWLEHACILSCP
mmetsp:Transcript_7980/g.14173  ORF Transcript_7980/g.14173 Transcript_7980/m.14173 type:complete len:119 (-) Transcript_7980:281-637(-)